MQNGIGTPGPPVVRKLPEYASFEGEKNPDVVIVGTGAAGSACAYEFSRKGYNTLVLDRGKIGTSSSAAGAGILVPEDGGIYDLVSRQVKEEDAVYSYRVNKETLDSLPELFDSIGIMYEKTGALGITLKEDPDLRDLIDDMEAEDAVRKNYELPRVEILTPQEALAYIHCPSVAAAIYYPKEEVLAVDSAGFIEGFLRGANENGAEIYENSEVLKIKRSARGYEVFTPSGRVDTKKVVVATQGSKLYTTFYVQSDFLKDVVKLRNAYMISVNLSDEQRRAIGLPDNESVWVENYDDSYNYIRVHGNRLFVGGEEGRISPRIPERVSSERYAKLREQFLELFPGLNGEEIDIERSWSGRIAHSKDKLPIVQLEDDMYMIHSVTAAGLVKSVTIARLLADVADGPRPLYARPKYLDLIDAGRFE